jgi:hypothetical protein
MRRLSLVFGFLLALGGTVFGGETVTLNGYVIDNMCAEAHKADADFADTVKSHEKSCALMSACMKSGYAVLADGKLYKLDAAGNKRIGELLKSSKADKGLAVTVEGTIEGDTVRVSRITEMNPTM